MSQFSAVYETEVSALNTLPDCFGFPKLRCQNYVVKKLPIIAMDLLGNDLEVLQHFCGGRFSLKTVLLIVDEVFESLEHLSDKGIVHNGHKPSNMTMALGRLEQRVFVVHSSFSTKFLDENKKHIHLTWASQYAGTLDYMSLNAYMKLVTFR